MEQQAATARVAAISKIKHLRWYICGLLFFATVVNYIDRQVLGSLAPELQQKIGWTESEYSQIVTAFNLAYALMFLVWGGILDRIGVKLGFAIALIVWSLAAMGHATVTSGTMLSLFEPLRNAFAQLGGWISSSWMAQIPVLGKVVGFLAGILIFTHPVAFGFGVMRFLLGAGEAANFPGAIKTVAE